MKIDLNEIEIIHIMNALRSRVDELRAIAEVNGDAETTDLANELEELEHDLFEAMNRPDDGWNDAADAFIQAGMNAREMAQEAPPTTFGEFEVAPGPKEGSRAAERRTEALMRGTAPGFVANDPIDW